MMDIAALLQQGSHNLWLFIPSALLLGALHGLEPGHSKTMMAAFIIAIRGTLAQAVMLGLAATVSHTAIVWLIAIAGLTYGPSFYTEASEPWLQLASAVIIIGIALWMLWQTWEQNRARHRHHGHNHDHDHDHEHSHHHDHDHDHHVHAHDNDDEPVDAHQRAHAEDIKRRFGNSTATTGQIILFGLTGGLIPCPASITVLLICLQLKEFALGATLVLCFSIGLAVTMVSVGAIAALGVRHASQRWSGFDTLAQRAPYLSGGLILLVGAYTGYLGWSALAVSGT